MSFWGIKCPEKKERGLFPNWKASKRPGVEEKYRNMSQPSRRQHWAAIIIASELVISFPVDLLTCSPGCLSDRVYDTVFIIWQRGPASMKSVVFGGRCRGSAKYIEILLLCN